MDETRPLILYVDDDPDYRDMVRVILEANGFRMNEAGTAEEGIRSFKRETPDLVLVDLMMEEIDAGTNLITNLRAHGADVPIYMLSSVGDDFAVTADTREMGLAGVFQKPIDERTLLAMLKARLG
ncbi:MAG: response regulator [Gemmatimonadota bacterium]|nr:response regulator [Gemmatimonadota bacterium]